MNDAELALLERFVVAQERQATANERFLELKKQELSLAKRQLDTNMRIAVAQERAAGTQAITDMKGTLDNVSEALEALMAARGSK